MRQGTAPLLSGHRVIQTCEPDEVRAFLHKFGIEFRITAKAARGLDACINTVCLPNVHIAYVSYGIEASVWNTEANCDYWVVPPLHGHLETVAGRSTSVCGPGRAFVTSPRGSNSIWSQEDNRRLSLRLIGGALTRQLSALLGEPLDRPLALATELDLTNGYGKSIAGYLHQAIADVEAGSSLLFNSIAANAFEQFIMTALLLSHAHNYSEALQRLDRPIAPRDVKRAIDYIEAHLESVISLGDIVAASGVPGRTLFRHFSDHQGVSPMRYLRLTRLQRVREELRQAEPEQGVSEIAMRWGFEHLGRFAVEYRERFGERPSETLKSHQVLGLFASRPSHR